MNYLSQYPDESSLQRDGVSQTDRVQAALDPNDVDVDGRSPKDLLAFAQAYAQRLRFFDVVDERVQAVGDWRAFLNSVNLDEVIAFMEKPEDFSPEQARRYARPHFALFLTFLQLLRRTQEQMNSFTRKHLDFYYRDVLSLTTRPGTPDKVNILVDLAPDIRNLPIPANTPLDAGTDRRGRDLVYRTDYDFVANRAQVATLSAIYTEKQLTDIRTVRKDGIIPMLEIALGAPSPGDPLPNCRIISEQEAHAVDEPFIKTLQELVDFVPGQKNSQIGLFMQFAEFRALMQLKGRSAPADKIWEEIKGLLEKVGKARNANFKFSDPFNLRDFDANFEKAMGGTPNFDSLTDLQVSDIYDLYDYRSQENVQKFIKDNLYFSELKDFERLVVLSSHITNNNEWKDWEEINRLLEEVGKKRTDDGNFKLGGIAPQDFNPRDFDANFKTATGVPPYFADISDLTTLNFVNSIYDLYRLPSQENLPSQEQVKKFIEKKLHFTSTDDFYNMMQRKVQMDADWDKIFRILEEAGHQKGTLRPDEHFPTTAPKEDDAFEIALKKALGDNLLAGFSGIGITDLETYDQAFKDIETYFFMPAEDFSLLMSLMSVANKQDAEDQVWDRIYGILTDAHKAKVYAHNKAELKRQRKKDGFQAMLDSAMKATTETTALQRLDEIISPTSPKDFATLNSVKEKVGKDEVDTITKAEWEEVYRIVELAQRVLSPEPVAQKEEWRNLYPAADVTAFSRQLGGAANPAVRGWQTFGQGQPLSQPPVSFGWAISSPLLALSQGERTIDLTLEFSNVPREKISAFFPNKSHEEQVDQKINLPFLIEVSTAKGWRQADKVTVRFGQSTELLGPTGDESDKLALQFRLTFGDNVDRLAPLPIEETRIDPSWPVLRLMLRPLYLFSIELEFIDELDLAGNVSATLHAKFPKEDIASGAIIEVIQAGNEWTISDAGKRYFIRNENQKLNVYTNMAHYQAFSQLKLLKTTLNVTVKGLVPLLLQNDESVLDPTKPFEPFGASPVVGSRLYLGHPELIYNKFDSLTFNIQWMGVPPNLKDHYKNYQANSSALIPSNAAFKVKIDLIDKKQPIQLPDNQTSHSLFNSDATTLRSIDIGIPVSRDDDRITNAVTSDDLLSWTRYLQWELNTPDFQHTTYPSIATQKSIKLAADIAKQTPNEDPTFYQVNPPYTPKIKALTLGYEASAEITYDKTKQNGIDRVFHLLPFGFVELKPTNAPPSFLPQFDYEGELYIGLRDVFPPQTLSLLFQMAEGSAANLDRPPAPVEWRYLSGNQWLPLGKTNLIEDGTRGLINSGIVSLALESADPSTLLPADRYWIRAAIPRYADSISDTIGIHAQAVSATFADQSNAPDHLRQPLPPARISQLTERLAGVASIRQPYASYAGKVAEEDSAFYTRVSERLRHRQRALTTWDYEHLILERFPEVYKAKCLEASPATPGQIVIIVIPDIKNKVPFNPFEPKAPTGLLADIAAYLAEITPPFAKVQVKNATYQAVKVRVAVRFRPGYDKGYYTQRLNEDLNRFLAPWAYEEGADIVIGGRIYANVIVNFLEERPYVDYIGPIYLFRDRNPAPRGDPGQEYWVEADKADVVLVGAREGHIIDLIPDTGYVAPTFRGIGYMRIGLDFMVR